jgi:tetratricopeptide (TPR) repeat protein
MAARERASSSRADGRAAWLPVLAAGLAAAVYLNALDNPFVYDDHATVLTNPSLVDLRNWRFVLVYSLFRPVVNVSYALDRALWGFQPFGFHVTNAILHALNVLLLFRFVRLAVTDHEGTASPADVSTRTARVAAFGASALLAVHPMMTEAVGYVSGRSEVLCGTFFLSALILMRKGLLTGGTRWLPAGFVTFLLALASKETAAAFPFVLLAYDRLCLPGSADDRRRRLWRVHVPLIALVVVAAAGRLVILLQAERQIAGGMWTTLLTQITVVPRYIGLLLVPVGQSVVHPVRQIESPLDPLMLASAALLAAVALAAWSLRRRAPLAVIGLLWFILVLAPSSSVIALRESMSEHRVYLASAGLFIVAGVALARWVRSGRSVARPWAVMAIALAVLGALTIQRNRVWASPIALWTEAAERAPMYWEPHYSLGDALREQRRCGEAIGEYRAVVAMRPDHRDALNNLGICLAETGQLAAAREAFERALAVDPGFARAETNLGGLALLERDPQRARRHFERALVLDPASVTARRQLATLHETVLGNPAEAARLCREILAIAPQTPGAAECVARNEAKGRSGTDAR